MTRAELDSAIKAKACPICEDTYSTQSSTLVHFHNEHAVIEEEYRASGQLVIRRQIAPPYRNERTPRILTSVLHNGELVPGVSWHAEKFCEGVEWAQSNLMEIPF